MESNKIIAVRAHYESVQIDIWIDLFLLVHIDG